MKFDKYLNDRFILVHPLLLAYFVGNCQKKKCYKKVIKDFKGICYRLMNPELINSYCTAIFECSIEM